MFKLSKVSEAIFQEGFPTLNYSDNFSAKNEVNKLGLYSWGNTMNQFYNTIQICFKVKSEFFGEILDLFIETGHEESIVPLSHI